MYKGHLSPEQEAKAQNKETIEQFLARGGQIQKIAEGVSGKRKRSNKIDAQALLNKALGTPQEQQVIEFLKSQGIEVE